MRIPAVREDPYSDLWLVGVVTESQALGETLLSLIQYTGNEHPIRIASIAMLEMWV